MKKRFSVRLFLLCAVVLLLAVTALAAEVTVQVKVPDGRSAELTMDTTDTVQKLRETIGKEFGVTVDGTNWWLYCSAAGNAIHYDYKMEDATKTLGDYDLNGSDPEKEVVYLEKDLWEATESAPVKMFGLTITGGTGARGTFSPEEGSADFIWNEYYKSITIRTAGKPLTISGKAIDGANILINAVSGSGNTELTLDSVTLHIDDNSVPKPSNPPSCLDVNIFQTLELTLVGTNKMTCDSEAAALGMSNDDIALIIKGDGSLEATSNSTKYPGIGTEHVYDDASWGDLAITIESGTVTANGGSNAPGMQARSITVNGGTLMAVSGNNAVPGLLAETITIGSDEVVQEPDGGAVQSDAYLAEDYWGDRVIPSDIVAVDAATIARRVVIVPGAPAPQPTSGGSSGKAAEHDHEVYIHGYPDGAFRPDGDLSRAEAAQMFYNLAGVRTPEALLQQRFMDVCPDDWYAPAVNALAELGVVAGVDATHFAPQRSITRAEFAAMAARFAKAAAEGKCDFPDVAADTWYAGYVAAGAARGWLGGYLDGTFRPESSITRAEVVAILNRMCDRQADSDYLTAHSADLTQFRDLASSHWAYADILEAANGHSYVIYHLAERWTGLVN